MVYEDFFVKSFRVRIGLFIETYINLLSIDECLSVILTRIYRSRWPWGRVRGWWRPWRSPGARSTSRQSRLSSASKTYLTGDDCWKHTISKNSVGIETKAVDTHMKCERIAWTKPSTPANDLTNIQQHRYTSPVYILHTNQKHVQTTAQPFEFDKNTSLMISTGPKQISGRNVEFAFFANRTLLPSRSARVNIIRPWLRRHSPGACGVASRPECASILILNDDYNLLRGSCAFSGKYTFDNSAIWTLRPTDGSAGRSYVMCQKLLQISKESQGHWLFTPFFGYCQEIVLCLIIYAFTKIYPTHKSIFFMDSLLMTFSSP